MRAIYLIARREYLSYVATWGFWLSLISVPLFMVLGASIPMLVQSSQPTRYYAVIDQTGEGYDRIVQVGLEGDRREQTRAALEAMAATRGPEVRETVLARFDSDPDGLDGLPDALEALGLGEGASQFATGFGQRVRVDAPASTAEGLRPYLTGTALVDTPEGPRSLFGALFVTRGSDRPLGLTWYSTNVTDSAIPDDARRVLNTFLRERLLSERGLSQADIASLNQLAPEILNLNPDAADAANAEVTAADRAPFFVSLILAFILWMSVFSIANMLLTSLIEEKGGKIIEVLLSTARFQEILIGKLAGVAGVSFTLFGVWGLVGGSVTLLGGSALAAIDPEIARILAGLIQPQLFLAAFCYFVVGYLMFGAIFLALGSLCETLQDAQSLMSPIILVLMAPLLILSFAMQAMDSMFVQIASWVPLWTPFVMMARLPTEPPLWELLGTTAVMLVTTVLVLWGAAAVFRQGALNQADADSVKRFFRFGRKKG